MTRAPPRHLPGLSGCARAQHTAAAQAKQTAVLTAALEGELNGRTGQRAGHRRPPTCTVLHPSASAGASPAEPHRRPRRAACPGTGGLWEGGGVSGVPWRPGCPRCAPELCPHWPTNTWGLLHSSVPSSPVLSHSVPLPLPALHTPEVAQSLHPQLWAQPRPCQGSSGPGSPLPSPYAHRSPCAHTAPAVTLTDAQQPEVGAGPWHGPQGPPRSHIRALTVSSHPSTHPSNKPSPVWGSGLRLCGPIGGQAHTPALVGSTWGCWEE